MIDIDIKKVIEQTRCGKYSFIVEYQKKNYDMVCDISIKINTVSLNGDSNIILRDFSKKYTDKNLIKYLTFKDFKVRRIDEFTIKISW